MNELWKERRELLAQMEITPTSSKEWKRMRARLWELGDLLDLLRRRR